MNTTSPIDFDGFWKEALEFYVQDFIGFFFPDVYSEIEWTRKPEFLDKELQQVTPESEVGTQRVDKLVKVWLKSGHEAWVLAHIEVQSQHETEFAKRVYVYNHRIFDRFDRQVASFAILGDEGSKWKPSQYGYELWGTQIDFRFSVVKLQEYRARWGELEGSSNPFATVVMAHLKSQETRHNADERQHWKWILTRMLYEKEYSRADILTLYRFIDWVMQLPKDLEATFWNQIQSYEEEHKMPYVSYAERRGLEQGLEQGRSEGAGLLRDTLIELLESNSSVQSEQIETIKEHLQQISELATLRELISLALKGSSLNEFHVRFEDALEEVKSDIDDLNQKTNGAHMGSTDQDADDPSIVL